MLELFKYTEKEVRELLDSMVILVDTREHEGKNEHILNYFDSKGISYKKRKLDYGDYSFMIPANEKLNIPRDLDFSHKIIVERKKDLEELSGNLTKERDRIEKELTLAPSKKVLLLENGGYEKLVTGDYNTKYNAKSYWATFHTFWHRYDIPIIFMPNPEYSGVFIHGFFAYYFKENLL